MNVIFGEIKMNIPKLKLLRLNKITETTDLTEKSSVVEKKPKNYSEVRMQLRAVAYVQF